MHDMRRCRLSRFALEGEARLLGTGMPRFIPRGRPPWSAAWRRPRDLNTRSRI